MIEHTRVMQVNISRAHMQVSILEWSILIAPMGDVHMSTYFLLNIQVGLRTQTRTYAHIVAT